MQTNGAASGMLVRLNEAELRELRAWLERVTPGPFTLSQPYALWQVHREQHDNAMRPLDEVATFSRSEDATFFLDAHRLLPRLLADYERLRAAERAELPRGA